MYMYVTMYVKIGHMSGKIAPFFSTTTIFGTFVANME